MQVTPRPAQHRSERSQPSRGQPVAGTALRQGLTRPVLPSRLLPRPFDSGQWQSIGISTSRHGKAARSAALRDEGSLPTGCDPGHTLR
jgi:hypothetical protein